MLGDRTSHGGVVVSGDPARVVDGQPIARVGDMVTCPRCKCVASIVTSRFPVALGHGNPVAYDGDMTSCGATLYSRHNDHAGWGDGPGPAAAAADALLPPAVESPPKPPLRFQEHFILKNNETGEPLVGVPYTIKTGDGKVFEGETDGEGRTEIVWSDSPKPVEVIAHPKLSEDEDPYHYAEQNYEGL